MATIINARGTQLGNRIQRERAVAFNLDIAVAFNTYGKGGFAIRGSDNGDECMVLILNEDTVL